MSDKTIEIIKDVSEAKLIFKQSQDCGAIIEANKKDYNSGEIPDYRFGRRVASVPTVVLDAWIREGIDYRKINKDPEMKKKFYAKLNSPEWRALRTHNSHL